MSTISFFCCLLTGCIDVFPEQEQEQEQVPPASQLMESAPTFPSKQDEDLHALIKQYQLTGQPKLSNFSPQADINSPKAQLGKQLFFSRSLSGGLDVACASCHHPLLGGGDDLSLSIGVGAEEEQLLGHGRKLANKDAPRVPRNAPTTFNVAFWKRVLFHDGRIERLPNEQGITTPDVPYPEADPRAGFDLIQAQARFPITAHHEMLGEKADSQQDRQLIREKIAARLGSYGDQKNVLPAVETEYWLNAFRRAYNAPEGLPQALITEENITDALSQYQRSQLFTDNAWKRYIEGDSKALSDNAKRGALLFYRPSGQGGYGCVACHGGDFFTDEQFHNTLMPPVGPGKSNANSREEDAAEDKQDKGRGMVTGNPQERFHFRTPSLLNVEMTGPWGHNGAYTTLANVVRHMIDPYKAATQYDRGQLLQKRIQTNDMAAKFRDILACDVDLIGQKSDSQDVQALVAFLLSLTDPCVKDKTCMQPWLPDKTNPNLPESMLLEARTASGHRL